MPENPTVFDVTDEQAEADWLREGKVNKGGQNPPPPADALRPPPSPRMSPNPGARGSSGGGSDAGGSRGGRHE